MREQQRDRYKVLCKTSRRNDIKWSIKKLRKIFLENLKIWGITSKSTLHEQMCDGKHCQHTIISHKPVQNFGHSQWNLVQDVSTIEPGRPSSSDQVPPSMWQTMILHFLLTVLSHWQTIARSCYKVESRRYSKKWQIS